MIAWIICLASVAYIFTGQVFLWSCRERLSLSEAMDRAFCWPWHLRGRR